MIKKLIPMLFISAALILTGCGKKTNSQTNPGSSDTTPSVPAVVAGDVTFDMTQPTDFVSQDSNSQVYQKGGVTFANNKASSTTNVAKYNPVRCYKNSQIVVSVEATNVKISKIYFLTQNFGKETKDQYSFKGTEPLSVGTWNIHTVDEGADGQSDVEGINGSSVTITCSACQVRIKTMVVTLVDA